MMFVSNFIRLSISNDIFDRTTRKCVRLWMLDGNNRVMCYNFIFYSSQEMFGDFISEMRYPNMLRPFDEIFEFQLPLRNAKLKFHSKVHGLFGGCVKIDDNNRRLRRRPDLL